MGQSDNYEVFQINDRLRELYGLLVDTGKQKVRVCHSDDQLEKRYGTFDLYAGEFFLREETGIREVPKYDWMNNQWVVEGLVPNIYPDVYEGDYNYCCLYAFPSGLPLHWEAIDLVAKAFLKILDVDKYDIPRTEQQAQDAHKLKLQKESAVILNRLDNTGLQSALHDGAAVSIPDMSLVKETIQ